jgi:hypothetical protein
MGRISAPHLTEERTILQWAKNRLLALRSTLVHLVRKILVTSIAIVALTCLVLIQGIHHEASWANWILTMPPGTFIGVLGAFAVVLAVFERAIRGSFAKVVTLTVAFSLLYIEIVDLQKAQKDQEHQYESIMGNFLNIQKLLIDYKESVERLSHLPASPQSPNEREILKGDAAALSHAILGFLVKQKVQPGYGQGGFGVGAFGGGPIAEQQTMDTYKRSYESKVIELRNKFAKLGITDPELEDEYLKPTNSYSLRSIAERLGALSDRL